MKFNKWTLGLAAVGVVSLASAARADEKLNPLETALSNTTISGYVSASFNWAISPGGQAYQDSPAAFIPFQGKNKQDGFNLDVVKLSIAKPQDESPWASGYQVDLLFGPDAVGYNPSPNAFYSSGSGGTTYSADFAIKQAYVALRTPVGNGIDWKIGVFDSPLGYEVFDAGSNPNYTRSWGYAIEPTELTGVLATYKINDEWSISAGIANTLMAGINARAYDTSYNSPRNHQRDWNKTFLGSVTFTAPSSWGWAAGSSFYAGAIYGFNGNNQYFGGYNNNGFYADGNQYNVYAGITMNTPWKQLTVGAAFDYVHNLNGGSVDRNTYSGDYYYGYIDRYSADVMVFGLYGTLKATDKLSFNVRGEYLYAKFYDDWSSLYYINDHGLFTTDLSGVELTGTVEYDLWANVISRLEIRWDHVDQNQFLSTSYLEEKDSVGFYANVIYKF